MSLSISREELVQLRDRLAKASGEDRGLDIDIACALLGYEKKRQGGYVGAPPDYAWNVRPKGRGWWSDGSHEIQHYTASIDAAVTLVPADFAYWEANMDSDAGCRAAVVMNERDESVEVYAKTPALALCLARIEYELSKSEE